MALRAVVLSCVFGLVACLSRSQQATLKLDQIIPLPGVEGRIDHLSADIEGDRVFVAALGNGTVEDVDLRRGKRLGEIKGLKEPQGLLYVASNQTLYVATGGDGMVRAYNAQTLAPVASLSLGDDADNLRFDRKHNRVVVGYSDGAIASMPLDLSSKAEIRLPAHPESFQFSPDGTHLFVNLPRDLSVASIDTEKMTSTKWGHLGALSNFPMAVDNSQPRIFVACRLPARLLALDSQTGSVTDRIATVGDADDLFYDEARKRIYVIGGEGFVDVVDAPENGKLNSIAHIPTPAGARTGLFVPKWNKLVVAAPKRGGNDAHLLVFSIDNN